MGLSHGAWSIIKGLTTPISNMFAGPRLEVTYARLEEPYIAQNVDSKPRVAYYRIDISNNGSRAAKDCQGFLDVVKTLKMANLYGGNLAVKPERLKWAIEHPGQPVNLDPHAGPRKLELFHVYENTPMSMHFPIKPPQTPVGTNTCVASDHYLLNVRLDYNTDRYIAVTLVIKPSDRYDQFSIDVQTKSSSSFSNVFHS